MKGTEKMNMGDTVDEVYDLMQEGMECSGVRFVCAVFLNCTPLFMEGSACVSVCIVHSLVAVAPFFFCSFVLLCGCLCVHACVHLRVRVRVCVCVCACVRVCVRACVLMYSIWAIPGCGGSRYL